jgi:hypothetical protein
MRVFDNSAEEDTEGALFTVEQEGAGDAVIQLLNPNRSWYWALDQSDSDKLKLATTTGIPDLSTDTVLTIDPSTGSINVPGGIILASDIVLYDTVNDGNPQLRIGVADTEELHIQAVYDTGAQTLDYVLFQTDVVSATSDKGRYRFNVDGTNILDITDSGIDFLQSGAVLDFAGDLTLTHSENLLTLAGGDLALGANLNIAATTSADVGVIEQGGNRFIYAYGLHNLFVGAFSGNFTLTGTENLGVGQNALDALTTGQKNTALGYLSGSAITTGSFNFALGYRSLLALTTGGQNVGIGSDTLTEITTQSNNIAIGHATMWQCEGAVDSVAIGAGVMFNGSAPTRFVAIGTNVASQTGITTAQDDVLIGYRAGYALTSGSDNVLVGSNAGNSVTTGSGNTAIGNDTGQGITTGSNNTIIGANVTGLSASLANNVILADGSGAIRLQFNSSGVLTSDLTASGTVTATSLTAAQDIAASHALTISNPNIGGDARLAISSGTGTPVQCNFICSYGSTATFLEAVGGSFLMGTVGADDFSLYSDDTVRMVIGGAGGISLAAGATWTDLGEVTTCDINGGSMDGVPIGAANAEAGTFTSLTTSGVVLVNSATQFTIEGEASLLQMAATDPSDWGQIQALFSNDQFGTGLAMAKSRNTTVGSHTVVANSDILGNIYFYGSDGTGFIAAANIIVQVDGTPGTNDMPGRIVFSTTPDGASTPVEALRIPSSGGIVAQVAGAAAVPVLTLAQNDVSEDMIEFVSTIGVGNAIEAVGAKTLTPTHFIKCTIDGVGVRYLQLGTIA